MNDERQARWENLLNAWREDVLSIWASDREKWTRLGLPDVADLRRTPVDPVGIARLRRVSDGCVDPEVLGFYSATDAWPLWLGSFCASMLPAGQTDLLQRVYPDAYVIAHESAPATRVASEQFPEISKDDLATAIVLTQPDARELVLSLRSGETCFYFFDGMRLYRNFYAFMGWRRLDLKEWLLDMLRTC
jgi:hypothetical protein